MNYLHHARLRRLLLPFALLGAVLLVRSRVPRPQTESDKWLWEMAEKAERLEIGATYQQQKQLGFDLPNVTLPNIRDRSAIRSVSRALETTAPFVAPSPTAKRIINESPCIDVNIYHGKVEDTLHVYQDKSGDFLWRTSDDKVATTHPRSVKTMLSALHAALARAQHHKAGYFLNKYE